MKNIAMVLMAAGNGRRFFDETGKNKLFIEFKGKKIYESALEKGDLNCFCEKVLVTQYEELANEARKKGFRVIINDHPEYGQSYTIKLATEAVRLGGKSDAAMYFVADQPLLKGETILRLIECYQKTDKGFVVPRSGECEGIPCIFKASYFPELEAIDGDRGGKQIIRKHAEDVEYLEVPREELFDIDCVADFEREAF